MSANPEQSPEGDGARSRLNVRRHLIRSFTGVGAMYMLGIPLSLLTNIVLARALGPATFGQYAFVMALLTVLVIPVSAGIPQLLTRELASYSHAGEWDFYQGTLRTALQWVLASSSLVILAYLIAGPISGVVPDTGKWGLIGTVVVLVPLYGLNAVRNGTIRGLGFPALAEIPGQFIQPVLLLACLASLWWAGDLTAKLALHVQVAVSAIGFGVGSFLLMRIQPSAAAGVEPRYQRKQWVASLLPFTFISVIGSTTAQLGIVLLGILGSDAAVGGLRVAERGAQLVALPLALMNMVISPQIVRTWREGDRDSLQRLARQSSRGAFMIALPVGLGLIAFGRQIITLAFGSDYRDIAYAPMVILVIGQVINVAIGSCGMLLMMSGHERVTLRGQAAGLLMSILLAIFLIPPFQALGAAIAATVGLLTWNVILGLAVHRNLKIRPGIL